MLDKKMLQSLLDGQKSIINDIASLNRGLNKKIEENSNKLDKLILQLDKLIKQRAKNRRF